MKTDSRKYLHRFLVSAALPKEKRPDEKIKKQQLGISLTQKGSHQRYKS